MSYFVHIVTMVGLFKQRRQTIDPFLHPAVVAEFEDSALLKAFGSEGAGIFPGPSAIEDEICEVYRVKVVGRTEEVTERFYAITVERRIKHPAVRLIRENAKERLFLNS